MIFLLVFLKYISAQLETTGKWSNVSLNTFRSAGEKNIKMKLLLKGPQPIHAKRLKSNVLVK